MQEVFRSPTSRRHVSIPSKPSPPSVCRTRKNSYSQYPRSGRIHSSSSYTPARDSRSAVAAQAISSPVTPMQVAPFFRMDFTSSPSAAYKFLLESQNPQKSRSFVWSPAFPRQGVPSRPDHGSGDLAFLRPHTRPASVSTQPEPPIARRAVRRAVRLVMPSWTNASVSSLFKSLGGSCGCGGIAGGASAPAGGSAGGGIGGYGGSAARKLNRRS